MGRLKTHEERQRKIMNKKQLKKTSRIKFTQKPVTSPAVAIANLAGENKNV